MANLPRMLEPLEVKLEDLLLDANNPRFAELGQQMDAVPEARFAEKRVQEQTYDRMKLPRFDVAELRDTIKNLGFLPMDRLVVRRWKQGDEKSPKYVVVEGNRRVAALKWLIELHESGRETFDEATLKNFTVLEVLLLSDEAPADSRWILPGLRHVSGIKEWGPYQKARAVFELREKGLTPQEAAQSLGLSTRAANGLWRSYLALEQMRADEEYGEHAQPTLYSYFEEVFKRAEVRDWLGWSDDARSFTAAGNLKEFYSWMIGMPDDSGELAKPRLPEAKSVRDFAGIVGDPGAMAVFRSPHGTLVAALARFEASHPVDWMSVVTNALTILTSMSADTVRGLDETGLEMLVSLRGRVDTVLGDHRKLAQ
jgi:hypothetical protein